MEKTLALFECVFIVRQDATLMQVEALTEQVQSAITENSGTIVKRELWGLRNLAYKIKKNRKGHYVLLNISAPANALHEMERQLRINEDVLRYMSIAVRKHEEGPSIMMQSRGRDDERSNNGIDQKDLSSKAQSSKKREELDITQTEPQSSKE